MVQTIAYRRKEQEVSELCKMKQTLGKSVYLLVPSRNTQVMSPLADFSRRYQARLNDENNW